MQKNDKEQDLKQQVIIQTRGDIQLLEKDIIQLNCDKDALTQQINCLKDDISQNKTSTQISNTHFKNEKDDWKKQINSLKEIVMSKDKEIMQIKAHEYDKVDIIKELAAFEGKNKSLTEENDRL